MNKDKKRILLADSSPQFLTKFTQCKQAQKYEFCCVESGPEVLEKAISFKPDLIILDLFLPKMHGIEIVNHLKANPQTEEIGFIITTFEVMMQNYKASIESGAAEFLVKPFTPEHLFRVVEHYFQGTLAPSKYIPKSSLLTKSGDIYAPAPLYPSSYLKFWGTRGSVSVAGPEFIQHGGNTSCLEIRNGDDLIIIDAGTGIRPLGDSIDLTRHKNLHIFISHTHLDHISAFPFFDPLYKDDVEVNVWTPVSFEKTTKSLFTELLAYSFFPIRLDELRASVNFLDLRPNDKITVGTLTVECCHTYHPGPTLGFKIRTPQKTVGYITDNEVLIGYHDHPNAIDKNSPLLEPHLELIEFLSDCELIIHEAQYFPQEYQNKVGWGHSSISNASVLFRFLNCREWLVTHHDPKHTDVTLQIKYELHRELLKECGIAIQMRQARDGLIVPL